MMTLWGCSYNPTPPYRSDWWLTTCGREKAASIIKLFLPAGTWSTSTHMSVRSGDWAPPVSFRQPSTAIGGRAGGRATVPPCSIILLWAHPLSCPHQRCICPTCPLTAVSISPRCLSSRKVMQKTTMKCYKTWPNGAKQYDKDYIVFHHSWTQMLDYGLREATQCSALN